MERFATRHNPGRESRKHETSQFTNVYFKHIPWGWDQFSFERMLEGTCGSLCPTQKEHWICRHRIPALLRLETSPSPILLGKSCRLCDEKEAKYSHFRKEERVETPGKHWWEGRMGISACFNFEDPRSALRVSHVLPSFALHILFARG